MLLKIKVKPNSKEEKIEQTDSGFVIYLKEPAEKNKANIALLKLLQKTYGSARIISGAKSKQKIIEVK